MTLPRVTFPDPGPAAAAILRTALAASDPAPTVTMSKPTSPAAERPAPHLQVADDGSNTNYIVSRTTLLRVVAWAGDRDAARALIEDAHSHLLAIQGGEVIRSVEPVSGPLDDVDSRLGDSISAVVVRVVTRPQSA